MDADHELDDEPLDTSRRTTSWPRIPAEMVASIALGLEDDLVVAARHGFSVEEFQALSQERFFQQAVTAKRAEFQKNGITFRAKAGWMAEELLEKLYLMAADSQAGFNQVHEALKTVMKAGGLEPKEEKTANLGTTFSISIDLGDKSVSLGAPAAEKAVIDAPTRVIDLPNPNSEGN